MGSNTACLRNGGNADASRRDPKPFCVFEITGGELIVSLADGRRLSVREELSARGLSSSTTGCRSDVKIAQRTPN